MVAATACALFTDLEGYRGSGTSTQDASVSDASNTNGETSTPSVDANISTGSYCAALNPKPAFCDDFDGEPLSTLWTVRTPAEGALDVNTTSASSKPRSLIYRTIAASSGDDAVGWLRKRFETRTTVVKLGFDLQIEKSLPDTSQGYIAEIRIGENFRLFFMNGESQQKIQQFLDGRFPPDVDLQSPTPGRFTRVQLTMRLGAPGASTISVTYDGQDILPNAPLDGAWVPGEPTIYIGSTFVNSPVLERAFRYDNVVIELE